MGDVEEMPAIGGHKEHTVPEKKLSIFDPKDTDAIKQSQFEKLGYLSN